MPRRESSYLDGHLKLYSTADQAENCRCLMNNRLK